VELFVVAVALLLIGAFAALLWLAHRSAAQTRARGYRSSSSSTLRWLIGLIDRDGSPRRRDG
jgi:hypothetical protein